MLQIPIAVKSGMAVKSGCSLLATVAAGGAVGYIAEAITESTTVSLPIAWVVGGAICVGCFWLATQLKGLQDGQKSITKDLDALTKDVDAVKKDVEAMKGDVAEVRHRIGLIEKKTKTVADLPAAMNVKGNQ